MAKKKKQPFHIANKLKQKMIFLSFCSSVEDILKARSIFDYGITRLFGTGGTK